MSNDTPHPGELPERRCPECQALITGTPHVIWIDGSRAGTGPCCSIHHAQTRAIRMLTDTVRQLRQRLRHIEGEDHA